MEEELTEARDDLENRIHRDFVDEEMEEKLNEKRKIINEFLANGYSNEELEDLIEECKKEVKNTNVFREKKFWNQKVINELEKLLE
jgi:SOS response regulatory protein OraA/RecX